MSYIYINREVSWLFFNAYVLEQAAQNDIPLIERLRFLGIYSNNLDEFYKVRYANLFKASLIKNQDYSNIIKEQDPKELLKEINAEVKKQVGEFEKLYFLILEELKKKDITILSEEHLLKKHKEFITDFFKEKLSPILEVYMLNEFSKVELKDGAFYLLVRMEKKGKKATHALIEVPSDVFPRFVILPRIEKKEYILFLEDLIRYHLRDIFAIFKFDHIEAYSIKITRDAEISLDSDLSKTFIEKITRSIEKRKKGFPVRVIYDRETPKESLYYLKEKMELDQYDSINPGGKYHNRKDLMDFPSLGRKDLVYPKFSCFFPRGFQENTNNYFKKLDYSDELLCVPYHDFSLFIRFLREAAIDPYVKVIKMTVYRVADTSQVMHALIGAARNGKEVTVVLELRARFDEAHNVYWAKKLQSQGIKIIFGVVGLKIHAKLLYVERVIRGISRAYAVISTGNFNEQTAKLYTDLILLTSHRGITHEVAEIFEFFNTNYRLFNYKHLLVSPNQMRMRLVKLIQREIKNAQAGLKAYIYLKVNSLSDKDLIDQLYLASQAGVEIKIQARSVCSLVPNKEKLSQNIEAISLVDRLLEHSRVYWFANGEKEDLIYISSADLMTRNLDFRLEVACPIYDDRLRRRIMDLLKIYSKDNQKARLWPYLDEKRKTKEKQEYRAQEEIYNYLKSEK